MIRVSVTQAKNQLSALLKRAREGETVLITDRGTPVATLEAVRGTADSERMARLERAGVVRPPRRPPSREVLATPPPRPRSGASVLAALLEERREGR